MCLLSISKSLLLGGSSALTVPFSVFTISKSQSPETQMTLEPMANTYTLQWGITAGPVMPVAQGKPEDEGWEKNKGKRRMGDGGNTSESNFPPTLGKKLGLRWWLAALGNFHRLMWFGEQTVLWGKVFTGKESLNKVAFIFNSYFYWASMTCQAPHRQRVGHDEQGSYLMELTL